MRRTNTTPPPFADSTQSSTLPTAQRRAPRPSCGPSSDKSTPSNPSPPNRRWWPRPPCAVRAPARTAPCFHYFIGHDLEDQKPPPIETPGSASAEHLEREIWDHYSPVPARLGGVGIRGDAKEQKSETRHGTLSLYKCVTSDDGWGFEREDGRPASVTCIIYTQKDSPKRRRIFRFTLLRGSPVALLLHPVMVSPTQPTPRHNARTRRPSPPAVLLRCLMLTLGVDLGAQAISSRLQD